ncbi:MAG TPA: ribonuclease P protein component [Ktedonobacterales bacterium]|nr:ribonuclease P protein component [Ktedonobacterales bacterium]
MKHSERIARISGRERFQRANRLRSPLDFARLRRDGRRTGGSLLAVSYAPRPAPDPVAHAEAKPPVRVGFIVSKRVGGAVVRNRVKRRLREGVRARLTTLAPGWDIVVNARPAAATAEYGALTAELGALFERAGLTRDTRDQDSRP